MADIVFVIPEDVRRAATMRRMSKARYVTISRLLWAVGGLTVYRRHNLDSGEISIDLRFRRKSFINVVIGNETLE